jgi:ABC-2 type transport system ATP-binding protein
VLELVGLTEVGHERVGGFSLEVRQRLGIASALLDEREVLILHEPVNGLGPDGSSGSGT